MRLLEGLVSVVSRRRRKEQTEWKAAHAHDWLERGLAFPDDEVWQWKLHVPTHLREFPTFPLPVAEEGESVTVDTRPTLFWVTEEMDQLAGNAFQSATDDDLRDILSEYEPPCPHGMVLYENLGGFPLKDHHKKYGVLSGMEWVTLGDRTWFRPILRHEESDPTQRMRPNYLLPPEPGERPPAAKQGPNGFELVLWTLLEYAVLTTNLMMTPTIIEQAPIRAQGRAGHLAVKAGLPVPEVNLLRLRPMRYEKADTDARGNAYKHRFVVSGHWRNQPYGKGRAKRRRTWVNPYIKGPEGAPLLNQKKVYVWAR